MTYDKQKALKILDNLKNENKYDENFCVAAEDLRNALSLGLICYTQHLTHWSDIPEHTDSDTKAYWIALHNIHKTLVEAGIFDDLE